MGLIHVANGNQLHHFTVVAAFTKYTKSNELQENALSADPSDPALAASRQNIQAATNFIMVGIPTLFFFLFLFMLTCWMVFKMIDSDDSGYIEVDELIFAVRHYAGSKRKNFR